MAVKKLKTTTALLITIESGTKPDGSSEYKTRTLNRVSPSMTDEDIYTIGAQIANLQAYPVAGVGRRDVSALGNE